MNHLRLSQPIRNGLKNTARYGAPINRWQHKYANEDGIFEEDFNYIEQKKMPQPFPENDPIFSHKGYPAELLPLHKHDFRYQFHYHLIPRRHFVPDFKMKVYNFSDFNEIVHRSGFNDFDLDHQLADPLESNHYINGRSPSFMVFMGSVVILLVVIYPLWGYGVYDVWEDPIRFRKIFHHPTNTLTYLWNNKWVGNNLGLLNPYGEEYKDPYELDHKGHILPTNIKRYDFADEYTFRI